MPEPTVLVIGGGPAGLLAAGRSAHCGARTLLLEKGPKTGRKLRMTGKGRCNITNTTTPRGFVDAFGPKGRFLYGPLSRFFRDDILGILASRGVEVKAERGGRIFPASDSALEVAAALEEWAAEAGAQLRRLACVDRIVVDEQGVAGVGLGDQVIPGRAAIICTGGASYPGTGSAGDGYRLAGGVGHTIVAPTPALSAVITMEPWVGRLSGLALRNVEVSIGSPPADGVFRPVASRFGEMLFTHEGLSGPVVLTLSREAPALLRKGGAQMRIDLKPALTPEQLHTRFIRDWRKPQHFKNYLKELLPLSMLDVFPELVAIPPSLPVHQITAEMRNRLVAALKGLPVNIRRMAALEHAIVTAGGVALGEVDSKTMMSRKVAGLYFAGEVLDLDAETGGYNLQAAFSTGWVAGSCAAERVLSLGSEE